MALGIAAVAAAGLVIYNVATKKDDGAAADGDSDAETNADALTEKADSPRLVGDSFFMDPSDNHEENEKLIVRWMND